MKVWRNLLLAGMVLLPGAAIAAPAASIWGPTGYGFTPDGYVLPHACVNIGYHRFELDNIPEVRFDEFGLPILEEEHPDVQVTKANIGLFDRLEVGVAYVDGVFEPRPIPFSNNEFELVDEEELLLNAKFALMPARKGRSFSLVTGVIDALDEIERTPYIYASKDFRLPTNRIPVLSPFLPKQMRAGVGWGTGLIDGLFINAAIPVVDEFEFLFEWLENGFPGFDEGRQTNLIGRVRTDFIPGLAIDLGLIDFDSFLIGGSYTHCFGGDDDDDGKKKAARPAKLARKAAAAAAAAGSGPVTTGLVSGTR